MVTGTAPVETVKALLLFEERQTLQQQVLHDTRNAKASNHNQQSLKAVKQPHYQELPLRE